MWLLLASLVFYAWWNIFYVPLIAFSILTNYAVGRGLMRRDWTPAARRTLLILGLLFNIGLLGYFKYVDFFISNLNLLGGDFQLMKVALPLAISFYTIQQVAYVVDVYEGLAKESRLVDYALFVTFFPQLIAGPIVHHKEIIPQFEAAGSGVFSYANFTRGLFVFAVGLFKKVIIADSFSSFATNGFDSATTLNLVEAWATSLSYTFQLYFDFSGYSDMAIGLGLMFNINLPVNFNSPLKSANIIDFWKRWHITLSNFITTYIFTPLVRLWDKPTFAKAMIAIIVSMFISGLWHGAAWTFVIWGGMHGMALVTNHAWRKLGYRMPVFLGWLITFNFVNLSFVFFRAKSWDDTFKVIRGMAGLGGIEVPVTWAGRLPWLGEFGIKFGALFHNIPGGKWTVVALLVGFGLLAARNSIELSESFRPTFRHAVTFSFLSVVSVIGMVQVSPFIYFNF